jgi:hypothetical protein
MLRLIIIPVLLLAGCNIVFFVSKDNVVRRAEGYMTFGHHYNHNNPIKFIPCKIDTSLSLPENLAKHKLGKAFYLYVSPRELNFLKIFGDTILVSATIVPVEIKYIQKREVIRKLRKQEKEYKIHFLKIGNKIYHYRIYVKRIDYISASPLLSKEKECKKTKDYENVRFEE